MSAIVPPVQGLAGLAAANAQAQQQQTGFGTPNRRSTLESLDNMQSVLASRQRPAQAATGGVAGGSVPHYTHQRPASARARTTTSGGLFSFSSGPMSNPHPATGMAAQGPTASEIYLTQTQRTLERTIREKHDLERRCLLLEEELGVACSERDALLAGQLQQQAHHVDPNAVAAVVAAAAMSPEHHLDPVPAQPDMPPNAVQHQQDILPVIDAELEEACTRAKAAVHLLYTESLTDAAPSEVVSFLTDRLADIDALEKEVSSLKKELRNSGSEAAQLAKALEKNIADQDATIKQLESNMKDQQVIVKDQNAAIKEIEREKDYLETQLRLSHEHLAQKQSVSPKRSLAEQLNINGIIAEVQAGNDTLTAIHEDIANTSGSAGGAESNGVHNGDIPTSTTSPFSSPSRSNTNNFDKQFTELMGTIEASQLRAVQSASRAKKDAVAAAEASSAEAKLRNQNVKMIMDANHKHQQEIDLLKSQLQAKEQELQAATGDTQALQAEVDAMKEELENNSKDVDSLKQALYDAHEERDSLAYRLNDTQALTARLAATLGTKSPEEGGDIHDDIMRVQDRLAEKTRDFDELQEKIDAIQVDADRLQKELFDKNEELEQTKLEERLGDDTARELEDLRHITTQLTELLEVADRSDLVASATNIHSEYTVLKQEQKEDLPPFPEGRWHIKSRVVDNGLPESEDLPAVQLMPTLNQWAFDVLKIHNSNPSGGVIYQVGTNVARSAGIFSGGLVNEDTWKRLMLHIQEGYRENPYHNAPHAADVAQATLTMLELSGFKSKLTNVELLATIFAALIHDLQHPGVNNLFLINTRDPVALRYNDRAVLESHHVATGFKLLQNPAIDITEKLTDAEAKRFRQVVTTLVLGTDMAVHGSHLKDLQERLKAGDFDVATNDKDKLMLLQLLMHAADISNLARPAKISAQWTERVTAEFVAQGEEEVSLGLPISPNCQPTTTDEDLAKSQVGFVDFVVLPLFYWLEVALPDLSPVVESLIETRGVWADKLERSQDLPPRPTLVVAKEEEQPEPAKKNEAEKDEPLPDGRWNKSSRIVPNDPPADDVLPQLAFTGDDINLCRWNFDVLKLNEAQPEGGILYQIGTLLAAENELFGVADEEDFDDEPVDGLVDEDTWKRLMLHIQAGYRENPYHNARHAADVAQATMCMLSLSGLRQELTQVEILATLFAALIHDLQHPGVNNLFLINTRDPVALRYNDRAVLESHHVATGFKLLQNPAIDITEKLTDAEAKRFRQVVTTLVLGTDMAVHGSHLKDLTSKLSSEKGVDPFENDADKLMLLQLLMHAADISNLARPIHVSSKWTERVIAEFGLQGDEEAALGLPISPGCEPNPDVPKSQVGFADFVILPLFRALAAALPNLDNIVEELIATRNSWASELPNASPVAPAPEYKPVSEPKEQSPEKEAPHSPSRKEREEELEQAKNDAAKSAQEVATMQELLLGSQGEVKSLLEENKVLTECLAEVGDAATAARAASVDSAASTDSSGAPAPSRERLQQLKEQLMDANRQKTAAQRLADNYASVLKTNGIAVPE